MKTLAEHNYEARVRHTLVRDLNKPHPNGIVCPNCRGELWDSDPMCTLTSDPAQKNVHCPKCQYRGYRIA